MTGRQAGIDLDDRTAGGTQEIRQAVCDPTRQEPSRGLHGKNHIVEYECLATVADKPGFVLEKHAMSGGRLRNVFVVALCVAFGGGAALAKEDRLPPPELRDDGLYYQDWFLETFLNLPDDLEEAAANGKRLVIFWEQRGCPYCKATHEINLRIPKIVDYIKANFNVLQLDLWGSRAVTDFDGQTLPEKKLARKYGVIYTPTLQFFPESLEKVAGRNGKAAEVLRVPGYFKPFHFYFLFRYAYERAYETEPNFQRYLSLRGDELRARGVDMDAQLWADTLLFE
jgi:thioredoxin-related protein